MRIGSIIISQVLLTVWSNVSGEAAGEITDWSLLGVYWTRKNGNVFESWKSHIEFQKLTSLDSAEWLINKQAFETCRISKSFAKTIRCLQLFSYWSVAVFGGAMGMSIFWQQLPGFFLQLNVRGNGIVLEIMGKSLKFASMFLCEPRRGWIGKEARGNVREGKERGRREGGMEEGRGD